MLPRQRYRRRVTLSRHLTPSMRLLLAAVLALCLGVRLLTPAGFMPAFAGGALTIVPCPDAEGAPPFAPKPAMADMAMPGHAMAARGGHAHDYAGKDVFHHQPCPYAAAASLTGLDTGFAALAALVAMAVLPPLARALPHYRRQATRERPPLRGPPLLA